MVPSLTVQCLWCASVEVRPVFGSAGNVMRPFACCASHRAERMSITNMTSCAAEFWARAMGSLLAASLGSPRRIRLLASACRPVRSSCARPHTPSLLPHKLGPAPRSPFFPFHHHTDSHSPKESHTSLEQVKAALHIFSSATFYNPTSSP